MTYDGPRHGVASVHRRGGVRGLPAQPPARADPDRSSRSSTRAPPPSTPRTSAPTARSASAPSAPAGVTNVYLTAFRGSDDGVATVFLYAGETGDPAIDTPLSHVPTWHDTRRT